MAKFTKQWVILLGLLLILAGCKVAVIVVEGGKVQSTLSGSCEVDSPLVGKVCIHEITDTDYTETFTAVADPGWQFVRWNEGGDFLCAESTSADCVVSSVGTAGNPDAEALIASEKTVYIMPVFTPLMPITDTLRIAGKEWAQIRQFAGDLTWDDVNAVCPGGVCTGGLKGYDLEGWTWASVEAMNALFNHYLGSDILGPGPDTFIGSWGIISDMLDDGWKQTWFFWRGRQWHGYIWSDVEGVCTASVSDGSGPSAFVNTNLAACAEDGIGAWFYRVP